MITCLCANEYYKGYDTTKLINYLQTVLTEPPTAISKEMLLILHKLSFETPFLFWNRDVANQVYQRLEDIYKNCHQKLQIDNTAFEYFIMGYNAYIQISSTITEYHDFNIEQDKKTRMFRLPTYTTIVEGVLSNLLRVILSLLSIETGKDYTKQTKLQNLVDVAKSNGFAAISEKINVSLRNAINHGKVLIRKDEVVDKVRFVYQDKDSHMQKIIEYSTYELDDEIDQIYDTASGVLMGLSLFINEHPNIIQIDLKQKDYLAFSLHAMCLSLPGSVCINISNTMDNKQINIEFCVDNTDDAYLRKLSLLIAIMLYERYHDYQQYMVCFSNIRMQNGWVRYKNEEIAQIINDPSNIEKVFITVMERKDCIIFAASEEDIDLNEIKYFFFPNHITERYKITDIRDASTPDRKRLCAHLFIGNTTNRNEILEIFDDAIAWLRTVKNPPCLTFKLKNGDMPADSLYIKVFREDLRKLVW